MSDLIIILTTMPDDDRAGELARTFVEERLAAYRARKPIRQ